MTNDEILNYPCKFNDVDAKNIKGYLKELLLTLWIKEEGFSGKRPFGNSGWQYDIYIPLIKMKAVSGKLDEYDCLEEIDQEAADKLILQLIHHLLD